MKTRPRIYQIDLLRFLAALAVVLYHYTFFGYNQVDIAYLEFESISNFSKYGYLGVDLFFIISGFVILMSAYKSNLINFIISRISRLYPAYWICLILTFVFLYFYGAPRFIASVKEFFINLTMFQGFIGVKHVDGVYWTLSVELKFYIIIGLILLLKKMKYIIWFTYAILGISFLHLLLPITDVPFILKLVYFFSFPTWSFYFCAGICFYLIWDAQKFKLAYVVPLVASYALAMYYGLSKLDHKIVDFSTDFSKITVGVIISSFYLFFILLSLNKLNFINKKFLLQFGMLTYPLYLIHQFNGYTIFQMAEGVNKYVMLGIVLILMFGLSFIIANYMEKPFGKNLRKGLKKLLVKQP